MSADAVLRSDPEPLAPTDLAPASGFCICCGAVTPPPLPRGWVPVRRPRPAPTDNALGVCPVCVDEHFSFPLYND